MSTAVMPQSTAYDFGDLFYKNTPGNAGSRNLVLETVQSTPHLAVGGPQLSPRQLHHALSRVSSNPATAASLVSSLLDNLQQQQQQHRRLERTQSAPVAAASVSATAVNTSRYKTELCRPFEESGTCKYGDKCQFAHGLNELRSLARHPKYKTELCRTYHTVGFCPYGPRCHFVHNQEEARQHNRAVSAILAARRSRPPALSPSLSLGSADSTSSSLSQSPTSSLCSFFSSEPELPSPSAVSPTTLRPQSPPTEQPDWRLPVFNRLSANMLALGDLVL